MKVGIRHLFSYLWSKSAAFTLWTVIFAIFATCLILLIIVIVLENRINVITKAIWSTESVTLQHCTVWWMFDLYPAAMVWKWQFDLSAKIIVKQPPIIICCLKVTHREVQKWLDCITLAFANWSQMIHTKKL